jgi:FkbM family methyltransferase
LKRLINRAAGLFNLEIRRKAQPVQQQSTNFQPYVKQIAVAGVEFLFWVADETGEDWYCPADFPTLSEHAETAKLIRPGDRVLELGSHHGFTTLMIAKMVGPSGFVLGVEPSPFNAMVACAQCGLNETKNCKILQLAASDDVGVINISSYSNAVVAAGGAIAVHSTTANRLDEQYGPFDVIKVDVEGFERQVLCGASQILKRAPRIILELHTPYLAPFNSTMQSVLNTVDPSRYNGTFITRRERMCVMQFDPGKLPEDDITNLFLKPIHAAQGGRP